MISVSSIMIDTLPKIPIIKLLKSWPVAGQRSNGFHALGELELVLHLLTLGDFDKAAFDIKDGPILFLTVRE